MKMQRSELVLSATALLFSLVAPTAQATPFVIGDIFASTGSGNIQHYNSAGTLLETLNNGSGGYTTGSAFDSTGNFYVTNFSSHTVSKFDGPNDPHTRTSFGSGYSTPESIVFDSAGNVYVGNVGGGIQKFDSSGNLLTTFLPSTRVDFFDFLNPTTILFTQEGTAIHTLDITTGVQGADFATGLGGEAFALRALPAGGALVANDSNVLRLDSSGAIIQTYDLPGVDAFFALNLAPDGTSFLTGSFASSDLYRFDIASGNNIQTIDTGCGGTCLFGVSLFGEVTVINPPPTGDVPEPATIALLGVGLLGVAASRRKSAKQN